VYPGIETSDEPDEVDVLDAGGVLRSAVYIAKLLIRHPQVTGRCRYTPDSPRTNVTHLPGIVGRSKIYNYMIFMENGGSSRARAIERPIMSDALSGNCAVSRRRVSSFPDGVGQYG
jgi:hypothetical protein